MAQLVVAAGSALLLGPAGLALTSASVGFTIGSVAFSLLNQPKYAGPRLTDLTAPKFDEGSVITIVEGHPRVPGIPIWQSDAREIEHTEGGKGSPSQTTYSYVRDVLFLVADGEIGGVAQAFENGKLVWTNLADADEASLEASANSTRFSDLRVYTGADDQDPDPTYEAAVGVGMAPAYTRRGTVMLTDVACDSGGRIGSWTFVVNGQSSLANPLLAIRILTQYAETIQHSKGASVGDGTSTNVCAVTGGSVVTFGTSHSDPIPYAAGATGRGNGDRAFLVFGVLAHAFAGFSMVGDGLSVSVALQDNTDYLGGTDIRWSTRGNRIAIGSAAALGTGAGTYGDVTVTGAKGKVYFYNVNGTYLDSATIGTPIDSIALSSSTVWARCGSTIHPFTITSDALAVGATFAAPAGSGHALIVSPGGVLHAVNDAEQVHSYSGSSWTLVTTLDAGAVSLAPSATTHYSIRGQRIYAILGVTWVLEEIATPYAWSFDDYTFNYAVYFEDLFTCIETRGLPNWLDNFDGGAGIPRRNVQYRIVSITPGPSGFMNTIEVEYSLEYYAFDAGPPPRWDWFPTSTIETYFQKNWGIQSKSKLGHDVYRQSVTPLAELVEPTLAAVFTRVCLRAGLEAGDIETAPEMDDILVHSMAIGTQSNARSVLDALRVGYGFDYYEGPKLRGVMRGAAPAITIPYGDLGARKDGEEIEPLNIKPPAALDVPQKYALRYSNLNNDGQPGVAYSDREVGDASGFTMTEVPLGLTPSEAQVIVDWQKLDARLSSIRIPLSLTDDYLTLECCDVAIITGRDGSLYRTRVDRTIEGDGIQPEVVFDDATIFNQLGAAHGEDQSSTVVSVPPETYLWLLDIPIQSDADNDAGFYGIAKGLTVPWPGAWFWDVTTDPPAHTATFNASSVFGYCLTILGDWTGPRVIDEINTVDVDVGDGTLSGSSTYSAVLNDSTINRFLIGNEIVQAINCVLISAGKYRLSRLLRGCRGTEWAMAGHEGTELFVRMGMGVKRLPMESSRLGQVRTYKAVTLGRQLSGATPYVFANDGVGLKPFSPIRLRVVRDASGNITFYWQRRSRLACRLIGSLGISVPLGEESEAYTVTIYTDNTYATVKRTISASSETAAYSSASQVTDFGSNQSTVYWGVAMVSGTVGAGYEERIAA